MTWLLPILACSASVFLGYLLARLEPPTLPPPQQPVVRLEPAFEPPPERYVYPMPSTAHARCDALFAYVCGVEGAIYFAGMFARGTDTRWLQ